jgi:hypothetical protein
MVARLGKESAMKFTAALYLAISDRIVEKAARCEHVDAMGSLLDRANRLWHRARRLEPPTTDVLTPSEIARLRRKTQVSLRYFRMRFAEPSECAERPPLASPL